MAVHPPKKPFDRYVWHWASLQPTEGLNMPPVYFGVLRAISQHEGVPKSSMEILSALRQVDRDTIDLPFRSPTLRLARDRQRNVIRNSGQYWQFLGLLEPTRGNIELTQLGRDVANRVVLEDDFIAATICSLELPNNRIETEKTVELWRKAGILLHPLRLILEIILALNARSPSEAFLRIRELCDIVIPLAGASASLETHVRAILEFRKGELDLVNWPNCTPKANDRRSASEYLRFLAYNGLLELSREGRKEDWHFSMRAPQAALANAILEKVPARDTLLQAVAAAEEEQLSVQIARSRRLVESIYRPDQANFRRQVFRRHGTRCIVTEETTEAVLVASHIIPAKWGGPEEWINGLPLRADIHILWDAGLVRIHPSGDLTTHKSLSSSTTYAQLPTKVDLPAGVARNLRWRLEYGV